MKVTIQAEEVNSAIEELIDINFEFSDGNNNVYINGDSLRRAIVIKKDELKKILQLL